MIRRPGRLLAGGQSSWKSRGHFVIRRDRQGAAGTVVAAEETVALRVSERQFTAVATQYPDLWRDLAIQAAKRLRQRLESVRPRNDVPIVFIGSSTESLPVARIVKKVLTRVAEVRIWDSGVFQADEMTLESLEREANQVDYAVMVFGPDDRVFCRGRASLAPRDNVVLELGLFMGSLGRKRAFVVKPRNKLLKIPSDLFGKNHIEYTPGRSLRASLKDACAGLVQIIRSKGGL